MQRLENVSPEEMNEVIRVATELHEKDLESEERRAEAADHARAASAAAEEVGLPAEYLERAAEVVQIRRAERVKRSRKRRLALAGVIAALGLGTVVAVQTLKPPPPVYQISNPAGTYRLEINPESSATFTTREVAGKEAAVVRVEKLAPGPDGTFRINLNTWSTPQSLAGYKSVSFNVQGTGLKNIRLYLEKDTERWRSPAVPITEQGTNTRLRLQEFDHQTRRTPSSQWQKASSSSPAQVQRLSFKLGTYVNEAGAKGEVAISDLRFEPE
jgi:hypothetical protein